MDYAVKRVLPQQAKVASYHLLDAADNLLLVADLTVVEGEETRRQLRLVRPDARVLATIDLPQANEGEKTKQTADYAIVADYAVYAIVSAHRRTDGESGGPGRAYFTLEVEGEKWLALARPDDETCYTLYDAVPSGLHTYNTLTELDLPPAIGQICRVREEYDYRIDLEPNRLQQTPLVVLAVTYLIDQARRDGHPA